VNARPELRGDELIAKRHLAAEPERVWAASILDALAAHLHQGRLS
jgi:hypothetical protein